MTEDSRAGEVPIEEVSYPGLLRPVRLPNAKKVRDLVAAPPRERYREGNLIGKGGAGEVRRSLDRALGRVVAVKTLRPELAKDAGMVVRFMHEAQVVAQLEHPAIVPVHDLGRLPDGRWFLTMKEIQGRTLRELITGLHSARQLGSFVPTSDGWTLRRLIEVFRTVCEAIAFAHSKGVLHRDLKPDNVMVGDYGEVYVVDWGLSRLLNTPSEDEDEHPAGSPRRREGQTRHGVVVGTPAYMPPEQARGDRDRMGPWSDVWALGALLYAISYGRPPYRGSAEQVLQLVQAGPPAPVEGMHVPEAIVDVWRRCMCMNPEDRYREARQVAEDIDAWLEGSRAREKALVLVDAARALVPKLKETLTRTTRSREKARAAVVALRPSDSLDAKESAWALEDEAETVQEELEDLYLEISTKARLALAQVADLAEARSMLADVYRAQAETAETQGDRKASREYRALLQDYDDGRHADYLKAEGELSLDTEPRGARVRIFRYEQKARRLVPKKCATTGPTPVRDLRLPVGSYILEIQQDDDSPRVRYPVRIGRGEPWKAVAPGGKDLHRVLLPPKQKLLPIERLVPAGWFISGGDSEAMGGLPRQRLWLDDFTIAHRPVSHREYLSFLNDLHDQGRQAEAERRQPRLPGRHREELVKIYREETDGRFILTDRVGELRIDAESPVIGVTWYDANAFCRWLTQRTGLLWRLPGELEREKAARGVDGRAFPWGDLSDPAFHCMQDSALGVPGPPPPGEFDIDKSPYGVLGLAGGVTEWCADLYRPTGPDRKGSTAVPPEPPDAAATEPRDHAPRRVIRGGAWNLPARAGRAASRSASPPDRRSDNLGFRVCRGYLVVDGGG
jgi:serine/threonine-protein kinase